MCSNGLNWLVWLVWPLKADMCLSNVFRATKVAEKHSLRTPKLLQNQSLFGSFLGSTCLARSIMNFVASSISCSVAVKTSSTKSSQRAEKVGFSHAQWRNGRVPVSRTTGYVVGPRLLLTESAIV